VQLKESSLQNAAEGARRTAVEAHHNASAKDAEAAELAAEKDDSKTAFDAAQNYVAADRSDVDREAACAEADADAVMKRAHELAASARRKPRQHTFLAELADNTLTANNKCLDGNTKRMTSSNRLETEHEKYGVFSQCQLHGWGRARSEVGARHDHSALTLCANVSTDTPIGQIPE
jgi:hypothetical protein